MAVEGRIFETGENGSKLDPKSDQPHVDLALRYDHIKETVFVGVLSDMMQIFIYRRGSQYCSDQIAVAMSEESDYVAALSRKYAIQSGEY